MSNSSFFAVEQPTPYPDLNGVLAELVESIECILADQLVGIYLQGSFAVGDFDEHSDVDFFVITGMKHLGQEWAELLEHAWTGRPNPAIAVREPADPERFEQTMRLVELTVSRAEQFMEEHGYPRSVDAFCQLQEKR